MEKIVRPRGTKDALPDETVRWRELERIAEQTATAFGFGEIRFPTFEHTELFVRGMGDTTDVVQKEMYTFTDKGSRSITLRPEGTASAVRASLENGLFAGAMPLKMYYIAPMFRYETPQSGRLREHHQFGAECFGSAGPEGDLEVIMLADAFLKQAFSGAAHNISYHINSIGCPKCRAEYREKLLSYLRNFSVCKLCTERMERNPLRVLDCKDENCREIVKNAPPLSEMICGDCAAHFETVKTGLSQAGIKYELDDRLVRGLDYYNGTVFEFQLDGLAIGGGGRYDGLVEQLGGNPTPACGFGIGLERVLMVQEKIHHGSKAHGIPSLYIATADKPGSPAAVAARALTLALRQRMQVERDICERSLKAQLRHADRMGAKYLLIIGENEVVSGQAALKRMSDGEKFGCALDSAEIYNTVSRDFYNNVMNSEMKVMSVYKYGNGENKDVQ